MVSMAPLIEGRLSLGISAPAGPPAWAQYAQWLLALLKDFAHLSLPLLLHRLIVTLAECLGVSRSHPLCSSICRTAGSMAKRCARSPGRASEMYS
jgi:hypothetical protein